MGLLGLGGLRELCGGGRGRACIGRSGHSDLIRLPGTRRLFVSGLRRSGRGSCGALGGLHLKQGSGPTDQQEYQDNADDDRPANRSSGGAIQIRPHRRCFAWRARWRRLQRRRCAALHIGNEQLDLVPRPITGCEHPKRLPVGGERSVTVALAAQRCRQLQQCPYSIWLRRRGTGRYTDWDWCDGRHGVGQSNQPLTEGWAIGESRALPCPLEEMRHPCAPMLRDLGMEHIDALPGPLNLLRIEVAFLTRYRPHPRVAPA